MILEQLIHECTKNNTKAQEQLYHLLAPKLFAVCLKYSRSYEEAQDNLQEGILLVFEKISQFKNIGSFEGWAKRVVINYILQQYRRGHPDLFAFLSTHLTNIHKVFCHHYLPFYFLFYTVEVSLPMVFSETNTYRVKTENRYLRSYIDLREDTFPDC
mgnify:CR=1 FL=1